MSEPSTIQTTRLTGQRIKSSDLQYLEDMHENEQIMINVGGTRSKSETAEYLKNNLKHWDDYGFGLWMLFDRENEEFVGRAGLRHVEIEGKNEIEITYSLVPQYWGRGIATEIASESVRIAFSILNLSEVIAFASKAHIASQRVMEKIGLTYEKDIDYKQAKCALYRLKQAT